MSTQSKSGIKDRMKIIDQYSVSECKKLFVAGVLLVVLKMTNNGGDWGEDQQRRKLIVLQGRLSG